ncbi:MAG TPA: class I SAM-dependent methyltransferase [Bryobacteraceae bacterium]|nr:class I SAM-dependent methyltransferase [Bryobacteraceae bacterium]
MPNVKILDVVSAIHKRVVEQAASYATPAVLEDWSNDLAKLNSAYNNAYAARNLVGNVPQLPNTFPGFVAKILIGFAQRILFWYTPQIRQFNEATVSVLNRICSLEDRKFRTMLALSDRLEKLDREVRELKTARRVDSPFPQPGNGKPPVGALGEQPGRTVPAGGNLVDSDQFFFELQGRFQSHVQADENRLEMYRSVIANLDPPLPSGTWLDIGCGRGGWLQMAREAGFGVLGVDSNVAALQHCREAGFEVAEGDALRFLQSAGDRSFAVVSAFHVLEHCGFEYGLNLVSQAFRTLKPGGILLIETPHPGNLLMAAEQFWIDPTHQRPIPLPLMEFVFEFCGFRVLHRFEVNARPESEQLPFRELELASRLNLLLYGPQDYALMGRRDEP